MANESVLRSVLDRSRNVEGTMGRFIVYAKPEEDGEGIKREVWLDVSDAASLGEPDQVTVTIEAGDKLNAPKAEEPT